MATAKKLDDLKMYFESGLYVPNRSIYLGPREDRDEVDHGVFGSFFKALSYLDHIEETPITVNMNSEGGDFYHGMAIYHAIFSCRSHVTIIGWGYCASIGSIILQAADRRVLAPATLVVIHDGYEGFSGDPKELERWMEQSKVARQLMYNTYLQKMRAKNESTTIDDIKKLCAVSTYYDAAGAVEVGLADEVLETL